MLRFAKPIIPKPSRMNLSMQLPNLFRTLPNHGRTINRQGYRSTDHVPLHFTTSTARSNEPRKKGALVIGEVLGVTVAGVAMAAAAVVVARHQAEASP